MPIYHLHRIKYLVYVATGNVLVKQITHRVYEDHPRLSPERWLNKSRWPEAQVEALLVRMPSDTAPSLRESLSVAIVTAGADLGAPGYRVPSCISPLDF